MILVNDQIKNASREHCFCVKIISLILSMFYEYMLEKLCV